MKITIESYGREYSAKLHKDTDLDNAIKAVVDLLIAVGYPEENIGKLFKDGDPRKWDNVWQP